MITKKKYLYNYYRIVQKLVKKPEYIKINMSLRQSWNFFEFKISGGFS